MNSLETAHGADDMADIIVRIVRKLEKLHPAELRGLSVDVATKLDVEAMPSDKTRSKWCHDLLLRLSSARVAE